MYLSLIDQTDFRLTKINEIKNYFIAEVCEREVMSRELSKYIAAFDYFNKDLIILSTTSGGTSFTSFATIIVASVGKARAHFSLTFSITTGIVKKKLKTTRNE